MRFAIVTDGPRGAWVDHDDFVGHIPAFRVDTIDTTGAGDAFTGGVLVGLVHGLGAEDAARLGAAVGALATTTIGTFSGPAGRRPALAHGRAHDARPMTRRSVAPDR